MDHKKAAKVLIKLLEKPKFSPGEKQALLTAIGVLSWTSLAQSRLKNKKNLSKYNDSKFKKQNI